MENSKIILINKESGISSHKAINKVKRELGFSKIGHAGTLDPLATGLMIAMTNKATKLSDILMKKDKVYIVEMKLGFETDSLDLDGKIIRTSDYSKNLTKAYLVEILNKYFLGNISQIPPMYSAIKINGQKMYDLARKDIHIDIPERNIRIYEYNDISILDDTIKFTVKVSSGTYIRSLVRDIAYRLNTVATMTYLKRVSIDKFNNPKDYEIINIYDALDYDRIEIDEINALKLKNGLNISIKKDIKTDKLHVFNNKKYLGIVYVISKKCGIIELRRTKFFY